MPFLSKSQAAWGHSDVGLKALGGKAKVDEWDSGTDYKNLPQRLAPRAKKKRLLKDIVKQNKD